MGEIIITVIFAVATPLVFLLLIRKAKSRGKRAEKGDIVMVKAVISSEILFTVVFYVAAVLSGILFKVFGPAYLVYFFVPFFGVVSVIGVFGYINDKFKYIVIKDDSIVVNSFFLPERVISYAEITYYNIINYRGLRGIELLNDAGRVLFSSAAGWDDKLYNLTYKLNDNGVFTLPNSVRKTIDKREMHLGLAIALALLGAMCLLPFGIFLGQLSPAQPYVNYRVSGTVANYKFTDGNVGSLQLTLENDNHVYFLDGVAYDELDFALQKDLSIGDRIRLLIACDEGANRCKISQIVLNGRVYLSAKKAEAAEKENYETNLTASFIVLGIACAFFAGAAAEIIYYIHVKKRDSTKNNIQ